MSFGERGEQLEDRRLHRQSSGEGADSPLHGALQEINRSLTDLGRPAP
jgi:hypothetical protein